MLSLGSWGQSTLGSVRARAHILPIDTYVRTQARVYTHVHPSTHTHTSTTYKREMRTLPILASKRSPGASFKLPAALSSLSSSLFLSLSPRIRLLHPYGYPLLYLALRLPRPPHVVERRILAARKLDLPQLLQRIVKIDRKLQSSDRRAANFNVAGEAPIISPIHSSRIIFAETRANDDGFFARA